MKYEFLPTEIKNLPNSDGKFYGITANRTDVALFELEGLFSEFFPYEKVYGMEGIKYLWTTSFIYKCLTAFTVDDVMDMDDEELTVFNMFIDYQDNMSTSATTDMEDGDCVGCTNPVHGMESYAVDDLYHITDTICDPADPIHPNLALMESLDAVFMDIFNCTITTSLYAHDTELIDVTNCPMDGVRDIDSLESSEIEELKNGN